MPDGKIMKDKTMATETAEDLDLNLDDLNESTEPAPKKFDLSSKKVTR